MLSPSSSTVGHAKQVTDNASSAFMDSFSSYRNNLGLPTVTLHLNEEFTHGDKFELMAPIKCAILNPSGAGSVVRIATDLGMDLKEKKPLIE